ACRTEALPRPPAAGAHHERRAFEPEVLVLGELVDLVGLQRLRRLRRGLALLEQRATARAVVGGLRVLEATFAAIHLSHRFPLRRRQSRHLRSLMSSVKPTLMRAVRPCRSGSA